MSWFDTHCHLQSFLRKDELEQILQRAEDAGVEKMVTVGTSKEDWTDYKDLAHQYPGKIYYSAGLHPGYVDENWTEQISGLKKCWDQSPAPVALGEIGLDYFRLPKDEEKAEKIIFWQKEAFRAQLQLGRELACPIIIHSRSAFLDCVNEIDQSGVDWSRVVFHCFSEGIKEISQLNERGGRASFTGIITFPKNERLWEAVKWQGAEKLMIETDCPYLAPVPFRGKRNEPSFLPEIGHFTHSLLSQKVQTKCWENSISFYKI